MIRFAYPPKMLFVVALAVLVSAGPMLMYVPLKLSGKLPADGVCQKSNGDSDFFAADGSPSECLKHFVTQAKGIIVTVVVVDSLWGLAQTRYKSIGNEAAWQSLAKESVQGSAVWEWPLYAYQNVPVLNRLYSPEGSVACIKKMTAGQRCGFGDATQAK